MDIEEIMFTWGIPSGVLKDTLECLYVKRDKRHAEHMTTVEAASADEKTTGLDPSQSAVGWIGANKIRHHVGHEIKRIRISFLEKGHERGLSMWECTGRFRNPFTKMVAFKRAAINPYI